MSRIFVTGDTHGDIGIQKFNSMNFSYHDLLNKDDFMIVLGDFGILWENPEAKDTEKLKKFYNSLPWTTLFIDGNHENHQLLSEYPTEIWNGGKIHRISDSVIHLMRGQVFTINDKTIFTMGGARSIDKAYRRENISWWKEELPSKEEYEEAISNLEKHNMTINYVLSHCCGNFYQRCILSYADNDELTNFLDRLEYDFGMKFDEWYFGHYHTNKRIDDRHTCLYDAIIEL